MNLLVIYFEKFLKNNFRQLLCWKEQLSCSVYIETVSIRTATK